MDTDGFDVRGRQAINAALAEYCSSTRRDIRAFELRHPIELALAPIVSFKLCMFADNCTRVLTFYFNQGIKAIDPDWSRFDECVLVIEKAIGGFWDGFCIKKACEVDVC